MKYILGLSFVCAFTLSARSPNIVFVFSDDHATQAIGAYGHPICETRSDAESRSS